MEKNIGKEEAIIMMKYFACAGFPVVVNLEIILIIPVVRAIIGPDPFGLHPDFVGYGKAKSPGFRPPIDHVVDGRAMNSALASNLGPGGPDFDELDFEPTKVVRCLHNSNSFFMRGK